MIKQENSNYTHKEIHIDNTKVTGSEMSLIRNSTYRAIGMPKINATDIMLVGLGNSKVKPIGCFQGVIRIDSYQFSSSICVVPDCTMKEDTIIRNELLAHMLN